MLLSGVQRFLDVDRRLFCTLERLVVHDLVKATELSLRVNHGTLYVCSTLLRGQRRHHASRHRHHPQASYSSFPFFIFGIV